MSNKTQLQTNNTQLDGYIARINAAKEVAAGLPEAGGSGSGGGNPTVGTFTVTDNGMYEPACNQYILSSDELHSSTRTCILVCRKDYYMPYAVCYRSKIDDQWIAVTTSTGAYIASSNSINESTVEILASSLSGEYSFYAW